MVPTDKSLSSWWMDEQRERQWLPVVLHHCLLRLWEYFKSFKKQRSMRMLFWFQMMHQSTQPQASDPIPKPLTCYFFCPSHKCQQWASAFLWASDKAKCRDNLLGHIVFLFGCISLSFIRHAAQMSGDDGRAYSSEGSIHHSVRASCSCSSDILFEEQDFKVSLCIVNTTVDDASSAVWSGIFCVCVCDACIQWC